MSLLICFIVYFLVQLLQAAHDIVPKIMNYHSLAQQAGTEGDVALQIDIDVNRKVSSVETLNKITRALTGAAVANTKKWQFDEKELSATRQLRLSYFFASTSKLKFFTFDFPERQVTVIGLRKTLTL